MQCNIINKLFQIINETNQAEKVPKDYGTGDLIYHSEINLLDAIFQFPNFNAVELANQMGVTRAAITQLTKKLEQRGLIIRYIKEGNKKEKYFKLTTAGETIKHGHDRYHRSANLQICRYLSSLDPHEYDIIISFLDHLAGLPISEFECGQIQISKEE